MDLEFTQLVSHLKNHWPSVAGHAFSEWGAVHAPHRLKIREAMVDALPQLSATEKNEILDLRAPPHPLAISVSISHTHDVGGWMSVARPLQIGWDVELKARIKMSTIERVCAPEEISEAVQPVFLWSAKEAFFKALEDFQPVAVTQIAITGWKILGPRIWQFEGLGPHNAYGILIESDNHTLAACVVG